MKNNEGIRNHIERTYNLISQMFGSRINNADIVSSLVFRGFYESSDPDTLDLDQVSTIKLNETQKNRLFIIQGLCMSVMLMDLYLTLNKRIVLEEAKEADRKLINRIIREVQKENDRYKSLFIDPKVQTQLANASLNFKKLSTFDKVLAFSCLNEGDLEVLKEINPYFEDEYKRFAIEISKGFLIDQINELIKGGSEKTDALMTAGKFLIDAFRMEVNIDDLVVDIINSSDEGLMQALVDEDADRTSIYLAFYYEANNIQGPRLK